MVSELFPWEQAAIERLERYRAGKRLVKEFGAVDLNNVFAVDQISEHLSIGEFEAYVFAIEHDSELAEAKRSRQMQHFAKSLAPLLLTRRDAHAVPSVGEIASNGISLVELVDAFLAAKSNAAPSTLKLYRQKCEVFTRFIAESFGTHRARIELLTPEMMRAYADFVPNITKHMKLESKAPLVQQVVTGAKTISAKTIGSHFGTISALLNWSKRRLYSVAPNLNSILICPKNGIEKPRRPLSLRELRMIFESVDYLKGTFKRPIDYWVPLLALYSGARQGELCQLCASDVYQDEETKIWLIDLNDQGQDKRLKTRKSKRRVPIHCDLVKLGFLDYVRSIAQEGGSQLFPGEPRDKNGHYAAFSKRFNHYRRRCGVNGNGDSMKDFHSLRHNVIDQLLDEHGCDEHVVNSIVGHSQADRSESVRTYSEGAGIATMRKWVQKLRFGLNLGDIKRNGWRQELRPRSATSSRA